MLLPPAATYEALVANFSWDIPPRFNIGLACADAWAVREPGRVALIACDAAGRITPTTYGELKALEVLGLCRRGYFVEGLGGAQFALSGAVERLRELRPRPGVESEALVLAAADPAQPYGAALSWPKREGRDRRPSRVAGAYVVSVDDKPVLYVERGGRGLLTLAETRDGEADPVDDGLRALAEAVRAGRVPKLALERIDGEPAIASELAARLLELGFSPGPRRLTLSA